MSFFVTFEGIEGSGKTTQVRYLESYLRKRGFKVVKTREPGGTDLGEKVRSILLNGRLKISPYAELFLVIAQRIQHIEEVILPSLNQGKMVLCDRFTDATLAYQGYGRGIDLNLINYLNTIATRNLKPHLTFLLDCNVDSSLRRKRTQNRFENEKKEFHEKVRNGYLEIARSEPERFVVLDGAKDKHILKEEIRCLIDERLKKYGIF
ncbi:MAG: dTMP kinase [Desulfobacterota bacterium]|nr:dTMP kinase [Thermodesulfobacteriota bacterium]MDW8001828.1 dTMP kinase [Deltaproteobacteria bacterium]